MNEIDHLLKQLNLGLIFGYETRVLGGRMLKDIREEYGRALKKVEGCQTAGRIIEVSLVIVVILSALMLGVAGQVSGLAGLRTIASWMFILSIPVLFVSSLLLKWLRTQSQAELKPYEAIFTDLSGRVELLRPKGSEVLLNEGLVWRVLEDAAVDVLNKECMCQKIRQSKTATAEDVIVATSWEIESREKLNKLIETASGLDVIVSREKLFSLARKKLRTGE